MLRNWVKWTAMQTIAKNTHPMPLPSFYSLKKRYWQWPYQKNPVEWPTVRTCVNQEERCRDKTLVHMINVQPVTDAISRRVTSGCQHLWITESSFWGHCRNSILLQQCLPPCVRSQASSSSFSTQQGNDPTHRAWGNRPSLFVTSPHVDRFWNPAVSCSVSLITIIVKKNLTV